MVLIYIIQMLVNAVEVEYTEMYNMGIICMLIYNVLNTSLRLSFL